jgi:hypothetical protein
VHVLDQRRSDHSLRNAELKIAGRFERKFEGENSSVPQAVTMRAQRTSQFNRRQHRAVKTKPVALLASTASSLARRYPMKEGWLCGDHSRSLAQSRNFLSLRTLREVLEMDLYARCRDSVLRDTVAVEASFSDLSPNANDSCHRR